MHSMAIRCTAVLLAGLAFGCNKPAPTPAQTSTASSPQTPETFNFAAQPVAFTPSPAGWEPEGELSRGIRGVRYVKRKSVGEAIGVGNYYDVSPRLRHAEIARLLTINSDYESAAFDHAVRETEEAETFDNLTHAFRRRLLFLVNDQHLLVVTSEAGGREHSMRGYETVRSSPQLTR